MVCLIERERCGIKNFGSPQKETLCGMPVNDGTLWIVWNFCIYCGKPFDVPPAERCLIEHGDNDE